MTLDQLRYFFETARFQHLGKAAKVIHISPSAISTAIASLESELGCALFERKRKSLILTNAGKALQNEAEKIFKQMAGIRKRITNSESSLSGHFRFGASPFLAPRHLSKACSEIQEIHKNLTFEVCSVATSQIVNDVVSGVFDLGVCFSPFRHPELDACVQHQGQLVIAVNKDHPLLKLSAREALKQFSRYSAVIHKDKPFVDLCESHPVFERYGVIPNIRFLFDSDDSAITRIKTSDSWTLIPDIVLKSYPKQVSPIKLPSDWNAPYTITTITRKARAQDPVLLKMKAAIGRRFRRIGLAKSKSVSTDI